MKKTWSGRFKKKLDKDADKFNASISFDKRLFKYDIQAGEAHARALAKAGVITRAEMNKMVRGLERLKKKAGSIKIDRYEDVHSAVEMELVKITGETGKKLHTGRSRNDLVATDTRLYLKDEIKEIKSLLKNLMKTIIFIAEKNTRTFMPGYTHMQRAQVITAGYWMMGYFSMFKRDMELLDLAMKHADVMPLGSGALAGSNYPIDRKYTAKILGFSGVSENGLDAVSDRDFVIDFLYFASMVSMHLSRLAEEVIIYNSEEFSFIEIDDSFATGSSLMPQKKNPDIPELIRGKSGKFFGNLAAGLTMMKSLPTAYNKDLQEDKQILFSAADELKSVLGIAGRFLKKIKFNKTLMEKKTEGSFMFAVDAADYLVGKKVPFRKAHEITGKLVAYCAGKKKDFKGLTEKELKKVSPELDAGVLSLFNAAKSVNGKKTSGSTSEKSVSVQIKSGKNYLKNES